MQNNIEKNGIFLPNEIVFHHSVSIKYLKEIWVGHREIYNELKNEFDKFSINIPIKKTRKFLGTTYKCDGIVNKLIPNDCYFLDKWKRENLKKDGYPYDIEWYKKMAKKCNLDNLDVIKEINPEIIQELLKKQLITNKKITTDEIKEYLLNNNVSKDVIDNLTKEHIKQIKYINLVGLNFLKNYSKFDDGGKKSKRIIKKSVRRKKSKKSSKRKSVKSKKSFKRKSVKSKKSVRRKKSKM